MCCCKWWRYSFVKQKQEIVKVWFGSGLFWVWMNVGVVLIVVIMIIGLLVVIVVCGFGYFWLVNVIEVFYQIFGEVVKIVIGEVVQVEEVLCVCLCSVGMLVLEVGFEFMICELFKLGNCEFYGSDFFWVVGEWLQDIKCFEVLMVFECCEWGNFYGYLLSVKENGQVVVEGDVVVGELQKCMQWVDDFYVKFYKLEKGDIGGINYGFECLCLKECKLQLDGKLDVVVQVDLVVECSELQVCYKVLEEQFNGLYQEFNCDSVVMCDVSGCESEIIFGKLVYVYQFNVMGLGIKMMVYFKKFWEFFSDDLCEVNIEGGIFLVIFGIVMMILVMVLIVILFGVIVVVYLCEYVKQGLLIWVICIVVNNFVGVLVIVYGVFGLGFFVYVLGGFIDWLFFFEVLLVLIFGIFGLFWVLLILVIFVVLVVIVVIEEGLVWILCVVCEGFLVFGVIKVEMLWKIVLLMVSLVMMIGLIFVVVCVVGEVVLLMLVGVVKLVLLLLVDGNYLYVYFDQKIMYFGFYIYDVGFQSFNVEVVWLLVYVMVLLLVVVIVLLNFFVIVICNCLCEKYKVLEN